MDRAVYHLTMAQGRRGTFFTEHVRPAGFSAAIGVAIATILGLGRSNPRWGVILMSGAVVGIAIWISVDVLELSFRPAINRRRQSIRGLLHALLFAIGGIFGWILGNIISNLLLGERPELMALVRGRGFTFMVITCGIVMVVGLVFRSAEMMRDRLAESMEKLKQHEWAQKELELARLIQKRLLPPQQIEGNGFSIAARNFPAHLVAGDFYDVVQNDDGSVSVIVADVAGKGIGASLIMASVKAVLPFVGRGSVEEAMTALNEKLVQELDRREFVALAYARFFPADGTLHVANAGFPDPYIIRGGAVESLTVPGIRLPLGIRSDFRYQTLVTKLIPADRLLFVSDGIPEQPLHDDQQLGYERLSDALKTGQAETADDWLEELLTRIRSGVREPLTDDWTAVVLQYTASARAVA